MKIKAITCLISFPDSYGGAGFDLYLGSDAEGGTEQAIDDVVNDGLHYTVTGNGITEPGLTNHAVDEGVVASPTPTPPLAATPTAEPTVTPSVMPTATVEPTSTATPIPTLTPSGAVPTPSIPHVVVDWDDFDGDGTSALAVYDPATGIWNIEHITSGVVWGGGVGPVPAPGDYNDDGAAELAYFDKSSGRWYARSTLTREVVMDGLLWGEAGDLPAPGDYDGDGTADLATWRPSDGRWRIQNITNTWYGQVPGIYPVPGDYNGDGTTDVAMVWPGSAGGTNIWYVKGVRDRFWMRDDSTPFPMDYDGDGTTDIAMYRHEIGWWYIKHLDGPTMYFKQWGQPNDIPVVGDFDGDGSADLTVFRNKNGLSWWWIRYTSKSYNYSSFSAQTNQMLINGATSY